MEETRNLDTMTGKKRPLSEYDNKQTEVQKIAEQAEKIAEQKKAIREAEKIARRNGFISLLNSITSRDKLIDEIDFAEFNLSSPNCVLKTGSGTDLYLKNTDSKLSSVDGCIQMSKFCRKQVHNTSDEMRVKLIEFSTCKLLKPLEDICRRKNLDFKNFVKEEVDIIEKIRNAISWLTINYENIMNEKIVQCLFTLYTAGLIEKLSQTNEFSVTNITGCRLEACILVRTELSDSVVEKKLVGKSDLSIMFLSPGSTYLHERSITVEMKYRKLDTEVNAASSTSQQLAQILAIHKMRNSCESDCAFSKKAIVRSILTDFLKVRLAVGFEDESSIFYYYITTLSNDPEYLLGGIILMQSEALKNIVLENIIEDSYDYGKDDNTDPEIQHDEQAEDDNIYGTSLNKN